MQRYDSFFKRGQKYIRVNCDSISHYIESTRETYHNISNDDDLLSEYDTEMLFRKDPKEYLLRAPKMILRKLRSELPPEIDFLITNLKITGIEEVSPEDHGAQEEPIEPMEIHVLHDVYILLPDRTARTDEPVLVQPKTVYTLQDPEGGQLTGVLYRKNMHNIGEEVEVVARFPLELDFKNPRRDLLRQHGYHDVAELKKVRPKNHSSFVTNDHGFSIKVFPVD